MGYGGTRIPKRFWNMKLKDFETTPGNTEAMAAVIDYIEHLVEHREAGTGLTLIGDPAVGKTWLMCEIGKAAHDAGYSVFYLPIATYMHHLLSLITWNDWAPAEGEIEKVRQLTLNVRNKIDFVLLDDVGKEHTTHTKYAEDEFDFLLRRRYDLALPTIMTSNRRVDDWEGRYSEAMASFIYEAAPPVEVLDKDRRRKR